MSKTKGFGTAGIITIIVALAAVGFIGWRVYEAMKPKPQPGGDIVKYIGIKEFAVKIRLDTKTADDSYVYRASTDGQTDSAMIYSQAMKGIDNADSGCTGDNAGFLGQILRSKDPYAFSVGGTKAIAVDNVTSFKIGDYYFQFQPPQNECSQSTPIGSQRATHRQDFVDVLRTIQAEN
jgi:hypothetical protein